MQVSVGRRFINKEAEPLSTYKVSMDLSCHWTLTGTSLYDTLRDKAYAAAGVSQGDKYCDEGFMNHNGWTFDMKIYRWQWEEAEGGSTAKVGKIVKVHEGLLRGKYAMIVRSFDKGVGASPDKGVGVITEQTDWPTVVPAKYNALFVLNKSLTEILEEEETTIGVKFPRPSQFK
jgi:hypothetical protein